MKNGVRRVSSHFCFGLTLILVTLSVMQNNTPLAEAQAGSGTVRVATTGTDASDCGSVAKPCRTIQYAVSIAASGDTIKIAQDTYTGSGSAVVSIVYDGSSSGKNLIFIGGYAPPDWSTPSTDPTLTVIDGQTLRRGIEIMSVPSISIGIQGITIQNGYASVPLWNGEYSGGGLFCRNDHPDPNSTNHITLSLSNVVIKNNRVQGVGQPVASGGGASLYLRCRANLQTVSFDGNQVTGGDATDGTRGGTANGGGLLATAKSDVTASNLVLTNNVVRSGSGGVGQTPDDWRADAVGGGASLQANSVSVTGITATGNQAIAGGGTNYGGHACGGALFLEYANGTAIISDGVLKGNSVRGGPAPSGDGGVGGGGALYSTDGNLSLDRLVVVNNTATGGDAYDGGNGDGGGLHFDRVSASYPGTVTATNLIVADNVAQAGTGINRWGGGGGIYNNNTALTLVHSTIAQNSVLSTMQGPAIVSLNYGTLGLNSSSVTLSYSIVASHSSTGVAIIIQKSGDVGNFNYTLFYNNLGGNYGCQFSGCVITNSNPVPSGDPAFVSPGSPNFDYHIGATSAAKDKAVGSTTAYDVDKHWRPYNIVSDVGAHEYGASDPPPTSPVLFLPLILKGH